MITTFFLNLFYFLISGILGLIPASQGLPPDISQGFSDFIGQANKWSMIFPVGSLLSALGIVISVEVGIFGWKVVHLVIRWIRG